MFKEAIKSLNTEDAHILKAREMANAIFKMDCNHHAECVEVIKNRLIQLHEKAKNEIKKV